MTKRTLSVKGFVIAGMLLASVLPISPAAAAEPQIRFLNPSGYSATVQISDKPDADGSYHLVAWVRDVPANPLVEFEFQPTAGTAVTIDATRVSADTWEANLSLSSYSDGQYTLRARLYANFTGPGTGTEVAATEQTVTLNRSDIPPPQAAETVELTNPVNGGVLGYFTPKGKATNALLSVTASDGTQQVRGFYTTSAPGTVPDWVECGSGRVTQQLATVRCTLDAAVDGRQVTAVAVVANETPPPAAPNPVGDATGDAHRVVPVAQIPTFIEMNPRSITAELSKCQVIVASVLDQSARPIAMANVDIHATGPDDQIRFGSVSNTTSGFQGPDSGGHVSDRAAMNCSNKEASGKQGDHNIPGADDPQHIESTSGTDNSGNFTFALYSDTTGTTEVIAWADVNDDDTLQAAETSGGASIGWGGAPEPARPSLLLDPRNASSTTGGCQRFVVAARQGGNPLVGENVDVHVTGPSAGVSFCTPDDASAGSPPDEGSHIGNADDDSTRHLEGTTDPRGNFVFGVTSPDSGTTQVTVWLDSVDDDVQDAGELSQSGSVEWVLSGDRSIEIQSNRAKVRKGRFVKIFGSIDGPAACTAQQKVKLQAKRMSGGRFRTIKSTTSDDVGDYSMRVRVYKSKKYRTVAPPQDICSRAKSRTITVRVRRG